MTSHPTIVLLPGLLCDAAVWQAVTLAVKPFAPVSIPDFSQASSIEAMGQSVLADTDGPLVAIGHSMGGRVALEMMRMAPERIVGLGLLDTGIHPRRAGEEGKRAALVKLGYDEGMAALADVWLPPMVDPRRKDDAALLAPMKEMVLRASPAQHERQIRALLDRPDARGVLGGIRCPTLVMVGRQDQWSPLAQHQEIAALVPAAKLVVIDDSGHMLPMEQPEATALAIAAWLRDEVLAAGEIDRIPDTPMLDRQRSISGYRLNKMAMGLGDPANRAAFLADEGAYIDRFGLSAEQKHAVMTRNWREMVRLGGNLFYLLKITAVDPARITEIGAHQAGMDHAEFLRDRLGKKV